MEKGGGCIGSADDMDDDGDNNSDADDMDGDDDNSSSADDGVDNAGGNRAMAAVVEINIGSLRDLVCYQLTK